jgi:3-deoxy-D-manno-octulosonate 8-phosphate phosphatase KdsC-like HAD superfamily phosphatase
MKRYLSSKLVLLLSLLALQPVFAAQGNTRVDVGNGPGIDRLYSFNAISGSSVPLLFDAASDIDGDDIVYRVKALPPVAQGKVYIGQVTEVNINQVLTATDYTDLWFMPEAGFIGSVDPITISVSDGKGVINVVGEEIPMSDIIDRGMYYLIPGGRTNSTRTYRGILPDDADYLVSVDNGNDFEVNWNLVITGQANIQLTIPAESRAIVNVGPIASTYRLAGVSAPGGTATANSNPDTNDINSDVTVYATVEVTENPPGPEWIHAYRVSSNEVAIVWAEVAAADFADYTLYRSVNDAGQVEIAANLTDATYSDTDVGSGNQYVYAVVANYTDNSSSDMIVDAVALPQKQSDRVLFLDGDGDYVQIADDPQFLFTNQAFTVEVWIKPAAFNLTWQAIVNLGDDSWRLQRFQQENYLTFDSDHDDGGNRYQHHLFAHTDVLDGNWHHVAITFDGSKKEIYVDGVLENSASPGPIKEVDFGPQQSLRIGSNSQINDREYEGQIDDVRIWGRALSATEIRENLGVPLNGNEEGLLGYWNFETDETLAWDASGHGNHGEFFGEAQRQQGEISMIPVKPYHFAVQSQADNEVILRLGTEVSRDIENLQMRRAGTIADLAVASVDDMGWPLPEIDMITDQTVQANQSYFYQLRFVDSENNTGAWSEPRYVMPVPEQGRSLVFENGTPTSFIPFQNANFFSSKDDFAIAFWVKNSSIGDRQVFVSHSFSADDRFLFEIYIDGDGKLGFWSTVRNADSEIDFSSAEQVLYENVWQHILITHSGGSVIGYVDGQDVLTGDISALPPGDVLADDLGAWLLGHDDADASFFSGELDELVIARSLPSATDIADAISRPIDIINADFVGVYHFDQDDASPVIYDASFEQNSGIFSTAASFVPSEAMHPYMPQDFAGAREGSGAVSLSWIVSASTDIQIQEIYRTSDLSATTPQDGDVIFNLVGQNDSFQDPTAVATIPYRYWLLAYDAAGNVSQLAGPVDVDVDLFIRDSLALVALYESLNGASWDNNNLWLSANPLDDWYGVTVTNGRVTSLNMNDNNVSGIIPEAVGELTELERFYLYDNPIYGNIPANFWEITSLKRVLLYNTDLSGTIPPTVANLVNLDVLFLNDNQFSGPIPEEVNNLTTLKELHLAGNKLTALPDLSPMTGLEKLSVENNQLTFADIEPNIGVPSIEFTYAPQDSIGLEEGLDVASGASLDLSVVTGGANSIYQWFKDGSLLPGETAATLSLAGVELADAGVYTCQIGNTVATQLTLYSRPKRVTVDGVTADLTVINNADAGPGSLRAAIEFATTQSGIDTIRFDANYDWSSNPIEIVSPLPVLENDATVILGDFGGTLVPGVEIKDKNQNLAFGLRITSSNNVIRGLAINHFLNGEALQISGSDAHDNTVTRCYFGTDLSGSAEIGNKTSLRIQNGAHHNTIGGTDPFAGNVFNSHTSYGIRISAGSNDYNKVLGNIIGLDKDGDAIVGSSNGWGIRIADAHYTKIGDGTAAGRNIISGNAPGLDLEDNTEFTVVSGNYFGTNKAGDEARTNTTSILNGGAAYTLIGSRYPGPEPNIIAGNDGSGIVVQLQSRDYFIGHNIIGATADSSVLGNDGAGIVFNLDTSRDTVAYNYIANNNGSAIIIDGANTDSIIVFENSIFANNDGISIRDNAQSNIAAPRDLYYNNEEILSGKSAPEALVRVYADAADQGRYYLTSVEADPSGAWQLSIPLSSIPAGAGFFTATQDSGARTSEFSPPLSNTPIDPLLVTTNANAGIGSLAFALQRANTNIGPDTIRFEPAFDWANNPILVDALLPIITDDSTVIIGNVDPGETPDVTIINNYSGADSDLRYGFQIRSAYNEIRGFIFSGFDTFDDHAVLVYLNDAHFNTIAGNYFGLNADGSVATGNYSSVSIFSGARHNTVGGYALADRNVIAGPSERGIYIEGSASFPTAHNKIINNFIGIDKDGESLNASQGIGIAIQRADSNSIGDGTAAGRNIISGNLTGIRIYGDAGDIAIFNSISGNYIGTDALGTEARPNGTGVQISSHTYQTMIGDGSVGGGNIISGSSTDGVLIEGGTKHRVLGNFIGLNAAGDAAIPNQTDGLETGSNFIDSLLIGDGTIGGRNVIAGNTSWNLKIFKLRHSKIIGNYIGTLSDGNTSLLNEGAIQFRNGENNYIGEAIAGHGNVIGGFTRWGGLYLADNDSLIIAANRIGIGADGTSDISAVDGILDASEPKAINLLRGEKTHIGTGEISNANYIGNFYMGIVVAADAGVTNIAGNVIGLEADGETAASNNFGLVIHSGGNHVNRNVISANESYGVQIFSNNNIVIRNTVGPVLSGNAPVTGANQSIGLMLWDAGSNQIGGNNYTDANIFAGNHNGLAIAGGDNNTVTYNRFGIGIDGTTRLPNSGNGIRIYRTANGNLLAHNQIVGSGDNGIWVDGSDDAKNNNFNVNSIFANNSVGIEIINGGQNGVVSPIINQINSDSLLSGVAAPEALVLLYADELNQGELFLDSVRADINGDWIYKVGLDTIPGRYVSLTALQDSLGNTSAFSSAFPIGLPPIKEPGFTPLVLIEDFGNNIIDLSTLFTDPDGGQLSFAISKTFTKISAATTGPQGQNLSLVSLENRNGQDTLVLVVQAESGLQITDSLFVTLTPVNDSPLVDTAIEEVALIEDFVSPHEVVGDLNTIFSDPEGQALSFTAFSDDLSVVTVNVSGNQLELNAVGNASGTANITVTADDGDAVNNTTPTTFVVTIDAVNDAPVVDNAIAPVVLAEDFISPNVVVADLNTIFSDPEGQALSFSASSDDESVVTVNVDGTKLDLNAVADASGTVTITVNADDGAAVNNTASTSFTVTIDAVNDAPVVDATIDNLNLDEDFTSPRQVVADLNTIFSDPEGQALSFSASSDDESVVTVNVDGTKLDLNAVADASGTVTITVNADDGAAVNNTASTSFTVTIDAVNDAPVVDATIDNLNLDEDFTSPRQVVADLNTIFSDPEGQTLTFTAFTSDAGVVTVSVTGDQLELNAVANASGTATITVWASDGASVNSDRSTTFEVTIAAENDKPDLTLNMALKNYIEGNAPLVLDNTLTITDVDNGNLQGAVVTISANYTSSEDSLYYGGATFAPAFDLASGTLTFSGGAALADYVAALRDVRYKNTSDNPVTDERTITFVVNDGNSDSDGESLNVAVTPTNDPPVVTLSVANVTYTEAAGPVVLDNGLVITDVDNADLWDAFIRISEDYVQGEDTLIYSGATLTPTFDEVNGHLRLNGVATLADYQQALREVSYNNLSANPTAGNRTVEFVLNDGSGVSLAQTMTVTVMPVNNKPVVTVSGEILAYNENSGPQQLDNTITVADVDNSEFVNATVQISNNYVQGEDSLIYFGASLISQFDVPSGTLILSGRLPKEDFQQILRDTYYENLSENPNTNDRTVSFVVVDGLGLNSDPGTMQIEITSDNDKPEINLTIATVNYTENDAPKVLDNALTLSDIDDTEIDGAVVTISGNYVQGEDVLSYGGAAFTPVFNPLLGTLTFSGSSLIADYEQALREVRFENTSEAPSTLDRTISFVVNDGSIDSDVQTVTVELTAMNDKPVVTLTPGSIAFQEGDPILPIDAALVVTDVDDDILKSASVSIRDNYIGGEDSLYVVTPIPEIATNYNATTGVLSLFGDAALSDYQDVLRSVGYRNVSSDPTLGARTVSIVVNDPVASSLMVDKIITVGTVNNPPELLLSNADTLIFTENNGPMLLDGGLVINDPDTPLLQSARVKIAAGYVEGEDVLEHGLLPTGVFATFDASNAELRFSGASGLADYQGLLQTVTFRTVSENPGTDRRRISFEVYDGADFSADTPRYVDVVRTNDFPVITTISLDDATQDVAYADTVEATDIDFGDVLTFSALDVPDWMTVNADGSLEGTPANADVAANVRVQVRVSDGDLADTLDVTIDVRNQNDAPVISTVDLSDATQDVAYVDTVKASDADGDALTFAKLNGPAWMTVNTDGSLEGTPTNADTTAAVTIEIEVSDGQGGSDIFTTSIAVINVNDKPEITTLTLRDAAQDVAYADTVKATDIDFGDVLTFSALDVPDWMTVNADGSLEGTPANADVAANVRVQVRVSDGDLADTLDVTIDVRNQNDAPVISTVDLSDATQDVAYVDTVKASDVDGDALTFAKLNGPAWMTVNTDGSLEGTPTNADTTAAVTIEIEVSDGQGGSDTFSTDIAVINVNDKPEITTLTLRDAEQDVAYADTVKATDIDFADVLTFSALDVPDWMTVKSDGSLEGTPANADVAANVRVQVRVSDGDLADTLDVTIDVRNQNDAPVISTVDLSDATQDVAYVDTVKASDADGDALTFAKLNGPAWMTVNTDGSLEGTPTNADTTAAVTIEIEVSDGQGGSDIFTTSIAVINVNDKPEITTLTLRNAEQDVAYADTVRATDIDVGETLTFAAISVPGWLTVKADGSLAGIPGRADIGTNIRVSVEVIDGGDLRDTLATRIAVIQINSAPQVANAIADQIRDEDSGEFLLADLNEVFRDAEDDVLTYTFAIPTGFSERRSADSLYLQPLADYFGRDTVVITATDPDGAFTSDTAVVTINAVNDAPVWQQRFADIELAEDSNDTLSVFTGISDVDNDAGAFRLQAELYTIPGGPQPDLLGMRFDAQSGEVFLNPEADIFGRFGLLLSVSDGNAFSAVDSVQVNVLPVNDAPVIVAVADTTIEYGNPFTLQVAANDIDNDEIRFSDDSELFSISAAGLIRFTPTAEQRGEYRITIIADDGLARDSVVFALAIVGDADAPFVEVELSDADSSAISGLIIRVAANDTIAGRIGDVPEELNYRYELLRLSDTTAQILGGIDQRQAQFYPLLPGEYKLDIYVADTRGFGAASPAHSQRYRVIARRDEYPAARWQMLSLAREMPSSFVNDLEDKGQAYFWLNDDYIEAEDIVLQPGLAIWYYPQEQMQLDYPDSGYRLDDSLGVTLRNGWNQLGNPYDITVLANHLSLIDGRGREFTLGEAVDAEWVFSNVYTYLQGSAAQGEEEYAASDMRRRIYRPWEGFWLYCNRHDLRLVWHRQAHSKLPALAKNRPLTATKEVQQRFHMQLGEGQSNAFSLLFDYGFDVSAIPLLESHPKRLLKLRNGKMQQREATLAEAETRHYLLYLRNPGKDELQVDFGSVARAFLFFSASEEYMELKPGSNVLARAYDEEARLVLTNDAAFDPELVPFQLQLGQNYPNPFNGATRIEVAVPFSLEGKEVQVEVFNTLGQRVATIFRGNLGAGRHLLTWDGRNRRGLNAASGVYFYRLRLGSHLLTRKAILLK